MKTICIYQIKNAINGKCYIGSTRDYANRKRIHLFDLRKGKHHSGHLQKAWNKYGSGAFQFLILEECYDKNLLFEREQRWLDKLLPEYNILPRAGSMAGRKVSEETKQRMSKSRKGIPVSEETKKKISASLMGRKIPREIVLRRAKTRTGIKLGPMPMERRIKISEALKGRICGPRDDQTKAKIAAKAMGRRHSDETKLKISRNRSGIGTGKRSSQICQSVARAKAVFDEQKIRTIRRLCDEGMKHSHVGAMFGIAKTTAGQIARRQTYKWVSP